MALTSKLSAIADAIRSKTGRTELLSLDDMPGAIGSIEAEGYVIPDEAFVLEGICSYALASHWDWFIENYGDKITTDAISNASHMFYSSDVESIPFDLVFNGDGANCEMMFYGCKNLKNIGTLVNFSPTNMSQMFEFCDNLRYLPEMTNADFSYAQDMGTFYSMFADCHSLRSIPEDFLKQVYRAELLGTTGNLFYKGFYSCGALDEIKGLNPKSDKEIKSNAFQKTFDYCNRLKNIIFALDEDEAPYEVSWTNQTIDLSVYVGYAKTSQPIVSYNSGLTTETKITDAASYEALKDNPDSWTLLPEYSRYNHDSAVATLNSLPDYTAGISANGGTNTIQFLGESGSATDGGAINTLTEEEIAVATAKGWTVSFV